MSYAKMLESYLRKSGADVPTRRSVQSLTPSSGFQTTKSSSESRGEDKVLRKSQGNDHQRWEALESSPVSCEAVIAEYIAVLTSDAMLTPARFDIQTSSDELYLQHRIERLIESLTDRLKDDMPRLRPPEPHEPSSPRKRFYGSFISAPLITDSLAFQHVPGEFDNRESEFSQSASDIDQSLERSLEFTKALRGLVDGVQQSRSPHFD